MATEYHIYANTGVGDPINYALPATTVSALTWTSAALSYPGTWSFGVRAYDTGDGLEEQNVDCVVTIILNASGVDITSQPPAPLGLRAFATANATIRVEWTSPPTTTAKQPAGYHVYTGTGGTPNYGAVAATVLYSSGLANSFVATLSGFTSGVTFTVGVRAYNATGEESNTNTVNVTADSVGPAAVVGLIGVATT